MIKIAVIGSRYFESHLQHIRKEGKFPDMQLCFISDFLFLSIADRVQRVSEELEKEQPHALVMGPHDYKTLATQVNIPCCSVHPTMQDFLLLHPYIEDYEKVAVILSQKDEIDIPTLEHSLNIRYHQYFYRNLEELHGIIRELKSKGFEKIISNGTAVALAQQEGMEGLYYFSSKTIEDGIQNALQIIENLEKEQHYLNEVRSILDSATCGAINISGSTSTVSFINRTALDILHRKSKDFIQQPLEHNFPKSIHEQILHCYEPINNVQFSLCGVDIIANIIPMESTEGAGSVCILFEKTDYILKRESIIRQGLRRKCFHTRYSFHDIKGKSIAMQEVVARAKRFAATNSTIFIHAETGAGKEVFAQSIHDESRRREYPFIAISCASIPDTLIESELFGYTSGSFTGARSTGKQGLIELANHGTVFLDDIDGLSYSFQAKLLRVIQEREIIRIGGDSPIPVDVRFVVATNRDLRKMVEDGHFRNDLYFRINVLPLSIPPLRDRKEDIPELYEYYLSIFDCNLYEKVKENFLQIFRPAFSYTYPGNVRELVNVAERFISLIDPARIADETYLSQLVWECLDINIREQKPGIRLVVGISGEYSKDLHNAEQEILHHYLNNSNCSMTQLAQKLNMSRATLYNKLRKEAPLSQQV